MIFDKVCADRSMTRPPRALGEVQSLALDTYCPLCGATFAGPAQTCECPPELAGAGRRVVEIRRAALEPAVVLRYGAGDDWGRPDIRFAPLLEAASTIREALT